MKNSTCIQFTLNIRPLWEFGKTYIENYMSQRQKKYGVFYYNSSNKIRRINIILLLDNFWHGWTRIVAWHETIVSFIVHFSRDVQGFVIIYPWHCSCYQSSAVKLISCPFSCVFTLFTVNVSIFSCPNSSYVTNQITRT